MYFFTKNSPTEFHSDIESLPPPKIKPTHRLHLSWEIPQRDGSPRHRSKGRGVRRIEALFSKINAVLNLYYPHAYAAWKKGSIENANRHVHRWYPKGTAKKLLRWKFHRPRFVK